MSYDEAQAIEPHTCSIFCETCHRILAAKRRDDPNPSLEVDTDDDGLLGVIARPFAVALVMTFVGLNRALPWIGVGLIGSVYVAALFYIWHGIKAVHGLGVALLVLVLAGCATYTPAPRSVPGDICVPPDFPPFATWRVGPTTTHITEDEDHRPVLLILRGYLAGGERIAGYWLNGILVAVDPAPMNDRVPLWIDTGAMRDAATVRRDARPSCRWERSSVVEERA